MNKEKIVVASGYFDPLHIGHIEYLEKSKSLGDKLIVIVNNDNQATLKKGKYFMKASDRVKIIRSLSCVDFAIESIDEDRSISKTLGMLHPHIFTNGGDQTNQNVPEAEICKKMNIIMADGLGEKIESSSTLIQNAKNIKNYKEINKINL